LDDTCGSKSSDNCAECRNACFRGSKNGPVMNQRRETRALRGANVL
jgi:hypothetical protein